MQEADQKIKILIVDDSDFSRKNISQMLNSTDYNIIGEASNGNEAISILKGSDAHIVILDIVMPEMSGFELAEFIKQNFTKVHIILISSLAQENVIIDAITAGASDFLQKPIEKKNLINSIEKIRTTINLEGD